MQIAIMSDEVRIPQALRERVKLRLRFALARFGEHIGRVTTRFWTLSTSTKSTRQRCLIEVDLSLPKTIKVETTDVDVLTAVERTASRLVRSIVRELAASERAPTIALGGEARASICGVERKGRDTRRKRRSQSRRRR